VDKTYDNKEILFVGVHWIRKGGPQLVEAFRRVRARIPDARLTIVGCSPEIHVEGCEVRGRVSPSELAMYYQRASVFCMPTRYEPFGIVYLEAMAYKLPIVATDVGAIPDFVLNGENGFRVRPGDFGDLAERLIVLLSNPALCSSMGKRGSDIAKQYTWERTGRIFRETIEPYVESYALEKR
jgi:glycosyltransferase involved in cell wall biosynthesis